jgi:hypothetical protein
MTEQEELEKLLTINEENLEYEWQEQPKRYVQCARLAARYEAAASLAKAAYEKEWADAFLRLKATGIPGIKVTDPAVEAGVELTESVIEKHKLYVEAEERSNVMRQIVRAFEMRERSLKYIQMLRSLPLEVEDRSMAMAARRSESFE